MTSLLRSSSWPTPFAPSKCVLEFFHLRQRIKLRRQRIKLRIKLRFVRFRRTENKTSTTTRWWRTEGCQRRGRRTHRERATTAMDADHPTHHRTQRAAPGRLRDEAGPSVGGFVTRTQRPASMRPRGRHRLPPLERPQSRAHERRESVASRVCRAAEVRSAGGPAPRAALLSDRRRAPPRAAPSPFSVVRMAPTLFLGAIL